MKEQKRPPKRAAFANNGEDRFAVLLPGCGGEGSGLRGLEEAFED
jgi:hypothetical protein